MYRKLQRRNVSYLLQYMNRLCNISLIKYFSSTYQVLDQDEQRVYGTFQKSTILYHHLSSKVSPNVGDYAWVCDSF